MVICTEFRFIIETPQPHPHDDHHPVARIGFLRRISRVVRIALSDFCSILKDIIWSPTGTIEVLGLQGSVVGSRGKSEVISQVSLELSSPSSRGLKSGLILQSD